MKIEYTELTLKALKEYKSKNPDKFKHKFGELDLEAIPYLKDAEHPDGFDMAKHRRMIKKSLPKTPLLGEEDDDDLDGDGSNYTFPKEKKAVKEEVSTNVDGGEALKDK